MRQRLTARATRLVAVSLAGACGLILLAASAGPGLAYSGAQAEAQSDPTADPYSFPNIQLCCKKKHHRHKPHYPPRPCGFRDCPPRPCHYGRCLPPEPPGGVLVACGPPIPHHFHSIQEALHHVREGGRIGIRPGHACDISGLEIREGVVIETAGYEYDGERAQLFSRGPCAVIGSQRGAPVSFRGVDIESCLVQHGGKLDLHEVNLSWRGAEPAIHVERGWFAASQSTVRARGTALRSAHADMVSLNGGGFASGPDATHVLHLHVDGAHLRDALIKGGIEGVYVGPSGRNPVVLSKLQVLRGEPNEIHRSGRGQVGIVVNGSGGNDGLPSLPSLPGARVSVEGSTIAGYVKGIVVHSGGLPVDLAHNRIKAKAAGIDLAGGTEGTATANEIECSDGYCVYYGGDGTSRSDRDFGGRLFRMSGTRCRD